MLNHKLFLKTLNLHDLNLLYDLFIVLGDVRNGKVVASVNARWRLSPCYMHSIAMTKNYLVLIEQPLSVSISDMLTDIMKNAPFIDGVKWMDEGVSYSIKKYFGICLIFLNSKFDGAN